MVKWFGVHRISTCSCMSNLDSVKQQQKIRTKMLRSLLIRVMYNVVLLISKMYHSRPHWMTLICWSLFHVFFIVILYCNAPFPFHPWSDNKNFVIKNIYFSLFFIVCHCSKNEWIRMIPFVLRLFLLRTRPTTETQWNSISEKSETKHSIRSVACNSDKKEKRSEKKKWMLQIASQSIVSSLNILRTMLIQAISCRFELSATHWTKVKLPAPSSTGFCNI